MLAVPVNQACFHAGVLCWDGIKIETISNEQALVRDRTGFFKRIGINFRIRFSNADFLRNEHAREERVQPEAQYFLVLLYGQPIGDDAERARRVITKILQEAENIRV